MKLFAVLFCFLFATASAFLPAPRAAFAPPMARQTLVRMVAMEPENVPKQWKYDEAPFKKSAPEKSMEVPSLSSAPSIDDMPTILAVAAAAALGATYYFTQMN